MADLFNKSDIESEQEDDSSKEEQDFENKKEIV